MRLINELSSRVNQTFGWDKRRIDCFCKMLVALMMVQSVNLKKLSCALFGSAHRDSSYRRLQRFFSGFRVNYNDIARLIVSLFFWAKRHGIWFLIEPIGNGAKQISIFYFCVLSIVALRSRCSG